ncbi:MAG: ADP-ribosylglycohydrolase [Alphaproteobacteria bacterium]|nr:ADP-ribosylglycohydrolase [Alphaproteobacteria bacterium]
MGVGGPDSCRADIAVRPAHPVRDRSVARERWQGMLLGLAIGDALGNTSESMVPGVRLKTHGEIRDYLPNRHIGGRVVGLPSDDTQLAFWTIEQILDDQRFDPARLAEIFASRRIFGMGASVRQFILNYRDIADPNKYWITAATESAGNGALMRAAGILVPHLAGGTSDLWLDAALHAAITHNDHAAISSAVAFVGILGHLLVATKPFAPEWWVETYCRYARSCEGAVPYEPRGGAYHGRFKGTLCQFLEHAVPAAWKRGLTTGEAGDNWYSGAYLLETVPTVLYLLMRHAHDPEEAIVRAVNDTKDNDTIAAIVGAAVGALHGASALPARWRERLLGRTEDDDDGRVFELLDRVDEWTRSQPAGGIPTRPA